MQLLRKYLIKFLIISSFIVLNTMAQTPFNAPFGFFGGGQSNGTPPVVTITAPANLAAVSTANQAAITVSGACSIIGRTVTIKVGATTLGTTTCGAGKTYSTSVDMTAIADDVQTITVSMSNAIGTVGTATVNIDKDVTGPAITISNSAGYAGGSSSTINFSVNELHATVSNYTLEISQDNGSTWSALGTVTGTAGHLTSQAFAYTWNPVSSWDITTVKVRISGTDSYGNATTQTSSAFVVDSTVPTLGAGSFSINSGAGSTTSTVVQLALNATDNISNITHFCFKHTSTTQPTISDSCWTSVTATPPNLTPATTLTLTNFSFILPPSFGTYNIYAWVHDVAGNISVLSNSGAGTTGLDKASIIYSPPVPPTVIDVAATSTDSPSTPFSASDLTVASGASVYIKWNATDDKALPATPVALYYTSDDVTYTLIASGITNSANAGCTISGSQTGCYKWTNGSPLSSYYRIRVTVVDSDSSVTASSSGVLNSATTFNWLAGNTDPGTGGSASAATFANTFLGASYMDPRSFVMTSTGVLYFLDDRRGLLRVDPSTGIQELLIKDTGVSAGDGLAITNSSVTLNAANEIIVDFQDNLYIYEYRKIRKIDMSVSPPVISTIVGGGASTADNVAGTSLSIDTLSKTGDYTAYFFATPDGKIYFRSDYNLAPAGTTSTRLRYWDPSNGYVHIKYYMSGTRNISGTDRDVTTCSAAGTAYGFDTSSSAMTWGISMVVDRGSGDASCPGTSSGWMSEINGSTGVIQAAITTSIPGGNSAASQFFTGMDGLIYGGTRGGAKFFRYEQATKTWTTLLGNGAKGVCADGTAATSCPLDLTDVFVSKNSTIYFIDRGRIRMVDPISGKVYTLYGQSLSSGDGGNPLSARLNSVTHMRPWSNGGIDTFVVYDQPELRFREFTAGGTISTIAGNGAFGTPDTTSAANTQPINANSTNTWPTFAIHPTTGAIYFSRASKLGYLNRGTGKWVDLAGGGTYAYYDATTDGHIGTDISFTAGSPAPYLPWAVDINAGGQVMAGSYAYSTPSSLNGALKLYDGSNGTQYTFLGGAGAMASTQIFCTGGTAATSCNVPNLSIVLSAYDSFTDKFFVSTTFNVSPGLIKLVTVGGNVTDYRTLPRQINSLAYRRDAGLTYEWFYYCGVNGKLYKYNNLTATETALNLPSTSMTCSGRGLTYSATRGSLIYGFTQNGLGGVAEYLNP